MGDRLLGVLQDLRVSGTCAGVWFSLKIVVATTTVQRHTMTVRKIKENAVSYHLLTQNAHQFTESDHFRPYD